VKYADKEGEAPDRKNQPPDLVGSYKKIDKKAKKDFDARKLGAMLARMPKEKREEEDENKLRPET